ncbi:MAG: phospholipase [Bacteroidia bacterium]|nr:phospholipase [Bacteroidia bacterium]MDW8334028.1 phospholipase [Bacteroidia bacterium]
MEYEIAVRRTARYYTVGQKTPASRKLWFVLHGYGQLAGDFVRKFEFLADETTFVVAPEAMNRFYLSNDWTRVGASWLTKEFRLQEIEDNVAYLEAVLERVGAQGLQITALGFSQGVSTLWRWLKKTRFDVRNVVLWAGSVPQEPSGVERFADANIFVVYGTQDPYLKPEKIEEARAALGSLRFRCVVFEGGHVIPRETLAEVAAMTR